MQRLRKYRITASSLTLCLIVLCFAANAFASWRFNPFTKKMDYYEGLQADSGVTVPQSYIASPTAENLRDMLVAAGFMDEAPPPAAAVEIVTWEDEPDGVIWVDEPDGVMWEDK